MYNLPFSSVTERVASGFARSSAAVGLSIGWVASDFARGTAPLGNQAVGRVMRFKRMASLLLASLGKRVPSHAKAAVRIARLPSGSGLRRRPRRSSRGRWGRKKEREELWAGMTPGSLTAWCTVAHWPLGVLLLRGSLDAWVLEVYSERGSGVQLVALRARRW